MVGDESSEMQDVKVSKDKKCQEFQEYSSEAFSQLLKAIQVPNIDYVDHLTNITKSNQFMFSFKEKQIQRYHISYEMDPVHIKVLGLETAKGSDWFVFEVVRVLFVSDPKITSKQKKSCTFHNELLKFPETIMTCIRGICWMKWISKQRSEWLYSIWN